MSSVVFLGPLKKGGPIGRLEVKVLPGQGSTLLRLIQQYGLPKECGCGNGQCGSCAVKVAVLNRSGRRQRIYLSDDEKEVLFASGKLTRQQYEIPSLAYTGSLWRLACQCRVGDQDIVVAYH